MFPVFRNTEERSMAKNYCTVNVASVVSKIFNGLDDSLQNGLDDKWA